MQTNDQNVVPDPQLAVLAAALSDLISGNSQAARDRLSAITRPVTPPGARGNIPIKIQAQVFARDFYTCGYCRRRTLCPPALRYISHHAPDLVPYHPHGKWDLTHPLYWEAYASCDHLLPVARGGTGDMDNLVTACYKCNTIKSSWLLEELGWVYTEPALSEWDGLSRVFLAAMRNAPVETTYFKGWQHALQSVSGVQR